MAHNVSLVPYVIVAVDENAVHVTIVLWRAGKPAAAPESLLAAVASWVSLYIAALETAAAHCLC